MLKLLNRGSSAIDWCEGNYLFTPYIAEFANTISNVLFLLLPPVLMYLSHTYARYVNRGIQLVWFLLFVVGISSTYFHATLSMVGQLLDEIAILWVVMASFALWFPLKYLPQSFNCRKRFIGLVLAISILSTILACINPAVNAFALMSFGIPTVALMVIKLKSCKNDLVYRLGIRCSLIWLLASICWINDKAFCGLWSWLNFPYLHAAWHILIFLSSYTAIVLFAYFDALIIAPEHGPVLKYWPNNLYEMGIPYIDLKLKHDASCASSKWI